MTALDEAKTIRSGEDLDLNRLSAYFKKELGCEDKLSVLQFPGGSSNLTYLVQAGEREWVLRKPPPGVKAKSAHDMVREATVLKAVKSAFLLVPEVIAICEDEGFLGSPFFVMERVKGTILRAHPSESERLSAAQNQQLCLNAVQALAQIHQIDWQNTRLRAMNKGDGYVQRQISGWVHRFEKAWTKDVPTFDQVKQWLQDHLPEKESLALIHNDFRIDNLVLDPNDPTRILAVLDWEMATIGDPLMDLGNSLAYWVEEGDPQLLLRMRQQPTHLPGMLKRREFVQAYLKFRHMAVDRFLFYRVYGLFRLAVIVQQIYLRYVLGQTRDKRFQHFGTLVGVFETYIEQVMQNEAT